MTRITALAGALLILAAATAQAAIDPPRAATSQQASCSLKPYGDRQPLPEGSSDDLTDMTSCLIVRTVMEKAPKVGATSRLSVHVTADRNLPAGRTEFSLQLPPRMSIVSSATDLKITTVPSTRTDGTVGATVTGMFTLSPGQTSTRTFDLKPVAPGAGTVRAVVRNPAVADPTSQASLHLTWDTTDTGSHFGIDLPAVSSSAKIPTSARPVISLKPIFNHTPRSEGNQTAPRLQRTRAHTAATACADGTFSYTDQNGAWHPARNVAVEAFDQNDIGSDTSLGSQLTDQSGHFHICFSNSENSFVESGTVDLYVTLTLSNGDFTVRKENGDNYVWQTAQTNNIPSGTFNYGGFTTADNNLQRGIHLFDELNNAWDAIPACWDEVTTCDQKQVRWSPTLDTWPAVWGSDHIARIPGPGPDSPVVVEHELGHMVMMDAYNGYWPSGSCTSPHYINAAENSGCAWREGWPNWFAGHVLQNKQLGWWSAPDNGLSGSSKVVYNLLGSSPMNTQLEDLTWADTNHDYGSTVESRIAGALWDYEDNAQDGPWDRKLSGFTALWNTFQKEDSGTFGDFWWDLGSQGYDNSSDNALATLYQNTIDLGGAFAFHDPLTVGKSYTRPDPPPTSPLFTDSDNFYPFKFTRTSSCINVTAKPKGPRVVSVTLYSDSGGSNIVVGKLGGPAPGTASVILKTAPGTPSSTVFGRVVGFSGSGGFDISVVSCLVLSRAKTITIPANVLATPLSLTPTAGGSITLTVTPKARGLVKGTADASVSLMRVSSNTDNQQGDGGTEVARANSGGAGRPETLRYTFPTQLSPNDEYVIVVNTRSGDGSYSVSLK